MKKLLLSLVACSMVLGATADDNHLTEAEMASVRSTGAVLSATQIANTCVVWPVVSQVVIRQLVDALGRDNAILAIVGGASLGFLASVATEQLINLSVLNSSKRYGAAILKAARDINDKYIPTGLIGFLAFLAAVA